MSYFEKQEWATIEDEIADLEAKIEEIEAAMLENASDYGQLATLQRDLDAANETLLEKYERYEYLSELEDKLFSNQSMTKALHMQGFLCLCSV